MEKPNLVLLVDDDEISNFINETILKGNLKNTEIHSFIDPHEALTFLKNTFDQNPKSTLLFLDINMPQMSGWEVLDQLKEIKEIHNFLKVIMISSSIDNTDKKKSRENSLVRDFISKPLSNSYVQNLIS